MATLNPFLSSSSPSLLRRPSSPSPFPSSLCFPLRHCTPTLTSTKLHSLVLASHDLSSNARFPRIQSSKQSILSNLIHEIEPLDVSLIQKDVPPATVDAMKRTISGMLGLLPSDQFQVLIESLWEPLSKLLVSSMMTGYTLRNAEYRLCLEKNMDDYEENLENQTFKSSRFDVPEMLLESANIIKSVGKDDPTSNSDESPVKPTENLEIQDVGDMSPEAQEYVRQLQSHLSLVKKELHEVKRRSAALQMQQFVGEEKNDLLDYLRSLQPEKG